jgi:Asp/Glu/hydantoin racemase
MKWSMRTPHILIINPNTSAEITASVERLAANEVGGEATVAAVTAPFGARYIASAASFSIAAHAVLDAYANAIAFAGEPDAVIVGCFGDPGIDGLREIARVPVLGFAESGILAAIEQPGTFIIATIGAAWRDILAGFARQRGVSERLAGVITIDAWANDPAGAARAIEAGAHKLKAERVIIGGTGLIPLLPRIAAGMALPVIDPHRRAVRDAIARTKQPMRLSPPRGASAQSLGLSPALASILGGGTAAASN